MANTYPRKVSLAEKYYTARHADVTVATASAYAVVAAQGDVVQVGVVIEAAITGADETLNLYKNGVDTTIDVTITQSGSAAADNFATDIRPGAVSVGKGDVLTLVSANASGGTTAAAVTYVVREL